jgi:galactokinase
MSEWVQGVAHGRVNLIGEHTDYNGGYVLPTAIPQKTRIELRRRRDRRVLGTSASFPEPIEFELGRERRRGDWSDYVQGVSFVLSREGHALEGFECRVDSEVPVGSGLSSSAALEIALLKALREAFGLELSDLRLAQLGQCVETDFVGARVGIMDQMAACLADEDHALFLDTRELSWKKVALPKDRCELVIIDSGIRHRNVGGDYNTRRAECERACEGLGIRQLRELGPEALASPRFQALPDLLRRRARHVITENARVLHAVRALESSDLARLGRLFSESHASMRDDYQVSIPEIDLLVEIASGRPGILGARLTGGGFGGSIVALAERGRGQESAGRIARVYADQTNESPTVLVAGWGEEHK